MGVGVGVLERVGLGEGERSAWTWEVCGVGVEGGGEVLRAIGVNEGAFAESLRDVFVFVLVFMLMFGTKAGKEAAASRGVAGGSSRACA